MRVLKTLSPGLGKIDSRQPDSPYISVFFHNSRLPDHVDVDELPSRNYVFEFELAAAEGRENGYQANFIQLVSPRSWRNVANLASSPTDRQEKPAESLADRHDRLMMDQRIIEHLEGDDEEEDGL